MTKPTNQPPLLPSPYGEFNPDIHSRLTGHADPKDFGYVYSFHPHSGGRSKVLCILFSRLAEELRRSGFTNFVDDEERFLRFMSDFYIHSSSESTPRVDTGIHRSPVGESSGSTSKELERPIGGGNASVCAGAKDETHQRDDIQGGSGAIGGQGKEGKKTKGGARGKKTTTKA